jgi:hypothetical protein
MMQMRSSATSGLARTIQRSPSSEIRAATGRALWTALSGVGTVLATCALAPCPKSTLISGEIIPSEMKFIAPKSAMHASATAKRAR